MFSSGTSFILSSPSLSRRFSGETPSAVTDLSAVFTPPDDLQLESTEPTDYTDERVYIWEGENGPGYSTDVNDPFSPMAREEGKTYNVAVRGLNNGKPGPLSNVATFDFFNSSIELIDQKVWSYVGAGTSDVGVNLDAMDGGALLRPAGSMVLIASGLRSSAQTGVAPVAAALQDDFQEVAFPTPLAAAGSQAQHASRIICKKSWVGDESNVVPMITSGLAGNIRQTYIANSYLVRGDANLAQVNSQCTAGNPTAQTLNIEDEGTISILAIWLHAATVDPSVIPANLNGNLLSSLTTTVTMRIRHMHRLWTPGTAKENVVWDPIDEGNSAVISCYFTVRPVV